MCSGERPVGAAKGKQSDNRGLVPTPPPHPALPPANHPHQHSRSHARHGIGHQVYNTVPNTAFMDTSCGGISLCFCVPIRCGYLLKPPCSLGLKPCSGCELSIHLLSGATLPRPALPLPCYPPPLGDCNPSFCQIIEYCSIRLGCLLWKARVPPAPPLKFQNLTETTPHPQFWDFSVALARGRVFPEVARLGRGSGVL